MFLAQVTVETTSSSSGSTGGTIVALAIYAIVAILTLIGFWKVLEKGGEPVAEDETGFLELWPLDRALERNREYGIARSLPGFFAFGSDGADELFLFDLRKDDGAAVCAVSAKAANAASVAPITKSFSEFLEGITLMAGA